MTRRPPEPRLETMIAFLRDERGLTLREIARAADLSPSTIYRFANGEGREPSHQAVVSVERIYAKAQERDRSR